MRRRCKLVSVVALACMALAAAPGCYTKVTDARGIGASGAHPVREKPTTTFVEDIGNAIVGERD